MGALDELRASSPGADFVSLLYRQVATVATVHRFPAPSGHRRWDVSDVQEAAHDFLVEGGHNKLIELAARVDDEEGLVRLLAVMVRNHLRQAGRRTTLGKLIIRLRKVLEDPQFAVVPPRVPGAGNYTLAGGRTEPFAGRLDQLVEAARAVPDIRVVKWSPNAKREGPVADAPSLRALSAAVLTAANGSVDLTTLAEILAGRLGLDPRSVAVALPVEDIDDLANYATAVGGSVGDTGSDTHSAGADADGVVAAILEQLSSRERLVLACLHETVRQIADQTGLPVSTAGAVKQRVLDKVRAMLSDLPSEDAEAAAVAARDAARREAGFDPL